MITAPYQRLPCVVDIYNSHDNSPLSAAALCVEDIFLFTKRAKAMGSDAPARKVRKGESLDTPAREACKGEESHDTPTQEARNGEESPDALKGASYQPSRSRRTVTPVVYAPTRGVQLGRIA